MKSKSLLCVLTTATALATLAVFLVPLSAQLQPLVYDEGALGLAFALRKLPITAGFLHTAAHPDDEDNSLLVMLNRGRGVRTGLLTLTRGGGGQNEIGPELFEALGILRTEELMSMHRYDGAHQFFGRAYDFGYSFSIEETFEKWGKEEILRDVVRVIRTFRPDVIVTLARTGRGGGQHHQAAARITVEAFRAAADPSRFPQQIEEGLLPWQAKKIYERYRRSAARRVQDEDERKAIGMETGLFDPLLGKTYLQVGMEGRSYHRCQGMPQIISLPGRRASQWMLADAAVEVDPDENDLFDGMDTSLFALEQYAKAQSDKVAFLHEGLVAIQKHIDAAAAAYSVDSPERTSRALAAGLNALRAVRKKIEASRLDNPAKYQILFMLDNKEKDFSEALRFARQLSLEALVDDGTVTPGQQFELTVTIATGSPTPVDIRAIHIDSPRGWLIESEDESPTEVPANGVVRQRFKITVPESAESTRPYWRRNPSVDRYHLLKPQDSTRAWSPPAVAVKVLYRTDGTETTLERSAQYRYEGPWVGGEQRHEIMVVPAVSLRVDAKIGVIPLEQAAKGREVRVTALYNGKALTSGTVKLKVPPQWDAVPDTAYFSFSREGQSITRKFQIIPKDQISAGNFEITAIGHFNGQRYQEGYQIIDYHHIQRRVLYRPSTMVVKTVDVKIKPGLRIGYVMGVGDQVPEALKQLGLDFKLLSQEDLAFGDLQHYDVIMTGVRAYLNREDLRGHNHRLLDWVKDGGTMIVQYNKFEFNQAAEGRQGRRRMSDSPYSPYPAQVGTGRVTDENAPVKILDPEHPVFNTPNTITEEDWAGWVQERGLYFLGKKDAHYRDLLSMEDSFEHNRGVRLGSLVEARYGRGRWIYVGLGLWRQLPAGVPGAYRILANLLSLGE
ncbi:PIG-L family deacetylase [Acidobacteria bacterium AH-259-L09]|nr:PIG-L family deacetylase [Acidobacteria bacterium AH-259-L09]